MNELVNQIAEGTATLLSSEDICQRLSVSRSTFDRWVKNGSTQYIGKPPELLNHRPVKSLFPKDDEGSISFPPPDIRIGNSPRWSIETFKKWLLNNLTSNSSK
jgi:predicted DNA-binding transcriptional regulator AlpA